MSDSRPPRRPPVIPQLGPGPSGPFSGGGSPAAVVPAVGGPPFSGGGSPAAPPPPPLAALPAAPQFKTKFRDLGAVSQIKGSAGLLCGIRVINTGQPSAFVQFFDAANPAQVNLGATTPDWEIELFGEGSEVQDLVIPFSQGIQIASTTTEKGAAPSGPGVMAFVTFS